MTRSRLPLVAVLLAAAMWGQEASAQSPGSLSGRITDGDKSPVGAARISVVGTRLEVESSADGSYRLSGVPPGHYRLEVKRLGYSKASLPFEIGDGTEMELSVVLSAIAVALDTVKVVVDTFVSPALRGFEERRERGAGRFFTREDLARMQPRVFTDVLRRVPGMQIQSAGGSFGNNEAVRSGRSGGGPRPCPILFYVNGTPFPLQQDFTINHFVAPEDVIGVEVYPGASETPPQFDSGAYTAHCGVVVIWTRDGIEKKRKR